MADVLGRAEFAFRDRVAHLLQVCLAEIVEAEDTVLAYQQKEGIFEDMHTEYHLETTDEETTISATTAFEAVDLPIVGQVLDGTVVKRQRSSELNTQFDWLEAELS